MQMAEAPTRLRTLRKATGLTQAQLGNLAGLRQGQVSAAEKGYASISSLKKLASALSWSEAPEDLLVRDEPVSPEAPLPPPQLPAEPKPQLSLRQRLLRRERELS
jgi:transcriptional regulator with XRE-family HTH domain